jgi:hypothetical protein
MHLASDRSRRAVTAAFTRQSMLWWPERFFEELAARGRYAILYNQRDAGLPPRQSQRNDTATRQIS